MSKKNVTYNSCTAIESLKWSRFYIWVYAVEAKNLSLKEVSLFLRLYLFKAEKVATSFLGIVNWKGKTVREIVDVIRKCFQAKNMKLNKIFFRDLDGTNSMSGTKSLYCPLNLYVNCRNCPLVLCLSHLTKDSELGELQIDYDAFCWVYGKSFIILGRIQFMTISKLFMVKSIWKL